MTDNKIRTKFTEMSKIFKEVMEECDSLKEENEKLKAAIQKHEEAYSLMCSEKSRRYKELMDEKNTLECEIRYAKLDGKI
jgi:DNA anti-recombination protein RmuC